MTNGDKFKEIFPNIIKYGNILIDDTGALQKNILFDDTWWNTEYKEPIAKNDKVDCEHTDCNNCVNHKYCDYEPTTKNDLAVSSGLEKTRKGFWRVGLYIKSRCP